MKRKLTDKELYGLIRYAEEIGDNELMLELSQLKNYKVIGEFKDKQLVNYEVKEIKNVFKI